ncbi:MAG: hypothetical protein RLZZ01_2730 [Actinomycetota bacterium]
MALDIRLLGDTILISESGRVWGSELPGPIGRHVLTRLIIDPFPIGRSRLIDDVWGADPPRAVESVLNATLSRIRSSLAPLGFDSRDLIASTSGTVNFKRPKGTRVDIEMAHRDIDLAVRDVRSGDLREAARRAAVVYSISRRPLLTGIERDWLDVERDRMHHVERRALGLLCEVALRSDRLDEAVQLGREHVRIAPFDERAHLLLVRALEQSGNSSGARKVVKDFTARLRDELDVEPSSDFLGTPSTIS